MVCDTPSAPGGWSMPALFTRISGGPICPLQCANASSSSALEHTSALKQSNLPEYLDCSVCTGSETTSTSWSSPNTYAPASRSASVQTPPKRPMTPVTTATFPLRPNNDSKTLICYAHKRLRPSNKIMSNTCDLTPPSIPPVSLGSGWSGFLHSWFFRIPLGPIRQVRCVVGLCCSPASTPRGCP